MNSANFLDRLTGPTCSKAFPSDQGAEGRPLTQPEQAALCRWLRASKPPHQFRAALSLHLWRGLPIGAFCNATPSNGRNEP